jgi:hypothetical protein
MRYVRASALTEPDPVAHARYSEVYPVYRETYSRLKDLYPRLSRAPAQAP